MNDEEYAKGCLEDAIKDGSTTEPNFTSWCGHGDCGIVNHLLKKQGEIILEILEKLYGLPSTFKALTSIKEIIDWLEVKLN